MNLEQVQKVENSPVESVKSTSLLQVPNNDGNQDPNNQFDSEER